MYICIYVYRYSILLSAWPTESVQGMVVVVIIITIS